MIAQSIAGLVVFTSIAWLISENRTKVSFKIIIAGIIIQLVVGLILLKLPVFRNFFVSCQATIIIEVFPSLVSLQFLVGKKGLLGAW